MDIILMTIFNPKLVSFLPIRKTIKSTVRIAGPLLVLLGTIIIVFLAQNHVMGIMMIFPHSIFVQSAHILVTALFLINIFYAYAHCVLRRVQVPYDENDVETDNLIENEDFLCRKCNLPKKYETTHHCSICKKCIDGMDHHCPWINNCVGRRNRAFFLIFLEQLLCSLIYSQGVWVYALYQNLMTHQFLDELGFALILELCFTLVLGGFSIWSWYLLLTRQTTITFKRINKNRNSQNHTFRDVFGSGNILLKFISPIFINID